MNTLTLDERALARRAALSMERGKTLRRHHMKERQELLAWFRRLPTKRLREIRDTLEP